MNNTHGDILHSPSTTNDLVYRPKSKSTITDGISSNHLYDNYPWPRGEVGWICPVCGRGLAPSTSYCPCHTNNNITFVSGDCAPNSLLNGAIDCSTTPPKAYYMVSATNTSKS